MSHITWYDLFETVGSLEFLFFKKLIFLLDRRILSQIFDAWWGLLKLVHEIWLDHHQTLVRMFIIGWSETLNRQYFNLCGRAW